MRKHPADNIPDHWAGNINNVFADMEAVRTARSKGKAGRPANPAEMAVVPYEGGTARPAEAERAAARPAEADQASADPSGHGALTGAEQALAHPRSSEQVARLRIKLAGGGRVKMICRPEHVDELFRVGRETFSILPKTPIQLHVQDGDGDIWERLDFDSDNLHQLARGFVSGECVRSYTPTNKFLDSPTGNGGC